MKLLILFSAIMLYVQGESSGGDNIALHKPVYLDAELAGEASLKYLTDGNAKTCADSGPKVVEPSLIVDLGEPTIVNEVNLIFPKSCKDTVSKRGCGYANTVVKVGNSPDPNHPDNEVCFTLNIAKTAGIGARRRQCINGPIIGRFVMIQKKGDTQRAIHLCEFRVKSEGDLAYNKEVTGINLINGKNLDFLVDGNAKSCADTGPLVNDPGFVIDLGKRESVFSISVTIDPQCDTFGGCGLLDFTVKVGDSKNPDTNTECYTLNLKASQMRKVAKNCDNGAIVGRYITLQKNGAKRGIYLCDVVAHSTGNLAYNKEVTSVGSVGGESTFSNLVDGNSLTCADSGRKVRGSASFVIDLGKEQDVRRISLKFPVNCDHTISKGGCSFTQTDIKVGNSPDPADASNTLCFSINLKIAAAKGSLLKGCEGGVVRGRYVILTKNKVGTVTRAIHLCELRVYNSELPSLNRPVIGEGTWKGDETTELLVDGNPNTCADSGASRKNTAFVIDLGETEEVEEVSLSLPSDCSDSLTGTGCWYTQFFVKIGDSRDPDGADNQVCYGLSIVKSKVNGQTITQKCDNGPISGRFIVLEKLKAVRVNRAMVVCDVAVFTTEPPTTLPPPPPPTQPPPPPPTQPPVVPEIATTVIPTLAPCVYPVPLRNVAQGKTATQSSTKNDASADKAVDGNKNSDMEAGQSCSQTDREEEPNWTVDLGQSYDIYEVDITNREDCCGFRIKHSEIRVGDSPNPADNPVCGRMILGGMAKVNPIIIRCGCDVPMKGRYVTVQMVDKKRPLTICEVEVLAG
ncbi:uncharacterized protein LOC144453020 [Glandiceps talaboti]